ncbi:MAG: hypothetical protein RLZZ597_2509 [Cyanobacteriota bacterium]
MNRPIAAGLLLLILLGAGACNRTDTTLDPTTDSSEMTLPTDTAPDAEAGATKAPGADAGAEDAVTEDHRVIPGQRVGQVTSTTSRQQLAEIYGEANLTDTEVHMGEGFTEPGTVVTMGSEPQFAVVWLDDSRSRPLMAKDFSADWKTPEGLGVGTSYATLQQQLGDFQLYGFAWDYGGTLSLEGSRLDHYYGNLLLRVEPSNASIEANPAAFQASMGDRLIPSTDPNLAQLDIAVVEMMVYLNDPVE